MSWQDVLKAGIPAIMLQDLLRYTQTLAEMIMKDYSDDEFLPIHAKKILDEIELLKRSGVK
jgi:hypothetical protein|tara:strand:+ start:67 stop:249 length:183 start_codon:yes stop_codon:yes gene_type:complete